MSRLPWLLASVAGRPETLNREAYEEIAREHLHEVAQLAAGRDDEIEDLNEDLAAAEAALADEKERLKDKCDQLDVATERADTLANELAAAQARIAELEANNSRRRRPRAT